MSTTQFSRERVCPSALQVAIKAVHCCSSMWTFFCQKYTKTAAQCYTGSINFIMYSKSTCRSVQFNQQYWLKVHSTTNWTNLWTYEAVPAPPVKPHLVSYRWVTYALHLCNPTQMCCSIGDAVKTELKRGNEEESVLDKPVQWRPHKMMATNPLCVFTPSPMGHHQTSHQHRGDRMWDGWRRGKCSIPGEHSFPTDPDYLLAA